ncbi:MAG: hypothetical protein GEV09_04075 [Pseudonocardiaceae bacterium]|nr:hypothetical protein [Pseudonocardiaceae bacterium]
MAAAIIDLPEEGQIVEVRGERWAVTDVTAQGLPRSSADDPTAGLQHAVSLQSIAEDRLGEELRVVWELEPGRTVVPEQGLPEVVDAEHFDDPGTLAAFVDALRWGALTSADARTVQAPFRSGATVEAFQLEPLRRALRSPRTNLLLADDVGLGKTIEAGLVVQELLLRHRARSVIIVCPAGLVLKWQDEMREKFGLEFQVIDSAAMRDIRRSHGLHANPFGLFPRVIVSMSWLPGQRAQRLLQQVQARSSDRKGARRFAFDILVVDEAHHVAPAAPHAAQGRRGYAVDSKRTLAVRDLANACEHRLFLSATPHNGYTESFAALLAMIDPQRFARGAGIDAATLHEVAVRRLKSDLAGQKGFRQRQVRTLPFEPTDDESQAYDRLIAFTRRRQQAAAGDNQQARDLATLLLKKRFFSSPVAFARTVDSYIANRVSGGRGDIPDYDEVLGSEADDVEEGLFDQPEHAALRSTGRVLPPLTDEDVADLEYLRSWGHGYQGRPDSRLKELITMLDAVVRPGGHWSNERVVIFTEYVDTLNWIQEVLTSRGYGERELAVITGSTDREERELIRERFNEPPESDPIRVLVATDAAGEGIDLQRHCHRLVNFDIPFNPNRLEQRIGRIDRYGQRNEPEIHHFFPVRGDEHDASYAGDTEFLNRIAVKIARVEIDLGSANEIIAPDIQRTIGGAKTTAPRGRRAARDEQAVNEVLHGTAHCRSRRRPSLSWCLTSNRMLRSRSSVERCSTSWTEGMPGPSCPAPCTSNRSISSASSGAWPLIQSGGRSSGCARSSADSRCSASSRASNESPSVAARRSTETRPARTRRQSPVAPTCDGSGTGCAAATVGSGRSPRSSVPTVIGCSFASPRSHSVMRYGLAMIPASSTSPRMARALRAGSNQRRACSAVRAKRESSCSNDRRCALKPTQVGAVARTSAA